MRSVIIGASAGLGRALAEELARRRHDLFLVASDERDIKALASDLQQSHMIAVHTHAVDLAKVDPTEIRAEFSDVFDSLDNLFLISGYSDPQDGVPVDATLLERLIAVNFTAGVGIVNAFMNDLSDRPGAHIVGIGSIAAVRGRRSNTVYAASKRGLEFYFEAVRHYLAEKPCRVQFYRVGYMATQMLGERRTLLPKARPGQVARIIVDRLDRPSGMFYAPSWWRWVMLVFALLPWPVFKRLDF